MTHFSSRAPWAIVGVALLAVTSGCANNSEAQLIGTWKIKPNSITLPTSKPGTNPAAAQMGQQMAQNMMNTMTLDLKADKKFTMNMIFAMEGTWSYDASASSVALKMEKMMGMDVSKMPNAAQINKQPMTLSLSNGELTMQAPAGQPNPLGGSMVFVKQ